MPRARLWPRGCMAGWGSAALCADSSSRSPSCPSPSSALLCHLLAASSHWDLCPVSRHVHSEAGGRIWQGPAFPDLSLVLCVMGTVQHVTGSIRHGQRLWDEWLSCPRCHCPMKGPGKQNVFTSLLPSRDEPAPAPSVPGLERPREEGSRGVRMSLLRSVTGVTICSVMPSTQHFPQKQVLFSPTALSPLKTVPRSSFSRVLGGQERGWGHPAVDELIPQ